MATSAEFSQGQLETSLPSSNTLGSQSFQSDSNEPRMGGAASPLDNAGVGSDVNDADSLSTKRKPGRPKGTGKKYAEDSPGAKAKRPVGRPRKDGLPAGSSQSVRRAAPRKSAPAKLPGPDGQEYYQTSGVPPQWPVGFSGILNGFNADKDAPHAQYPIDPNLDGEDWNTLAITRPHAFLSSILACLAAPNPVSNAGPSVEEAFKSHLVSVAPNPSQPQPIPSLYSILRTFWLPSSPSYFSLTASASMARTPSEHRFLYWDPQPLVFNGIGCPNCAMPLTNRGRIRTGPIKIYDLEKPFFVIGCEYVCRSNICMSNTNAEGRKFASTDSSILRSLPAMLRDEFPALLNQADGDAGCGPNVWNWQAMGVSRPLWNMIKASLRAGLGRDAIIYIVRSIQHGVDEQVNSHPRQEEEEEEEGDGEEKDRGEQRNTDVQMQPEDTENKDNFQEAYATAWKDNSAIVNGTESGPNGQAESPQKDGPPPSFPQLPPAPPFYPYAAPYSYFQPIPGSSNGVPQHVPNNKRAFTFSANGNQGAIEPAPKRMRHCCKCGGHACKGKGGRSFCMNACQDCGKLDCKGRNSRRPDKRCMEAWL